MATTREEAMVRMGFDSGPLDRGLAHSKNAMQSFGDSAKSIFNQIGVHLAAAFTVGAVMARLDRVSDKVGRLAAQSEKLGASVEFIQGIESIGKTANLTEREVTNLMDKFQKMLPVGSDFQAEFYGVADRIAAVEDPATRAQIAVDAFGEAGLKMIPVLAQGSEGLRELSKEFATISTFEVQQIEHAGRLLQQLKDRLDVFTAKSATSWILWGKGMAAEWNEAGGGWGGFKAIAKLNAVDAITKGMLKDMGDEEERQHRRRLARAQAEAAAHAQNVKEATESLTKAENEIAFLRASHEEKVKIRIKERDELYQRLQKLDEKSAEHAKVKEEWIRKEYQVEQQIEALKRRNIALAREEARLKERSANAAKAAKDAEEDRSRVTIDELVNKVDWGTKLDASKAKAIRVKELEQEADKLRLSGDFDGSQNILKERDKLMYGDPTSKEAQRLRAQIEAAKRSGKVGQAVIDRYQSQLYDISSPIAGLVSNERNNQIEQLKIAAKEANQQLIEFFETKGIEVTVRDE